MELTELYAKMRGASDPFPLLQVRAGMAWFAEDRLAEIREDTDLFIYLYQMSIVCKRSERPLKWAVGWNNGGFNSEYGILTNGREDRLRTYLRGHPLSDSEMRTLASSEDISLPTIERLQVERREGHRDSYEAFLAYLSLLAVSNEIDLIESQRLRKAGECVGRR